MQTIQDKIKYRIRGRGRGSIISCSDFYDLGSRDAVASTLKRLKKQGYIRHQTQGIYDYPAQDALVGSLEPSLAQIIAAIEKRDNMPIYPSGAYAAHLLGLTEQIPMNTVFISLRPRVIAIGNRRITIKKASAKLLGMKHINNIILSQAIRWIGVENLSSIQLACIQRNLTKEDKKHLLQEIRYMPLNQHLLIHSLAE